MDLILLFLLIYANKTCHFAVRSQKVFLRQNLKSGMRKAVLLTDDSFASARCKDAEQARAFVSLGVELLTRFRTSHPQW